MMKQETDWACGIGAASTRRPFSSVCRSNVATRFDGIDRLVAPGEMTRRATEARPERAEVHA